MVVRREMENGGERLEVRRAMENGRPEVRRAMESGGGSTAMDNRGERRLMENGGGTMRRLPEAQWVMCSTCSGFVSRMQRTTIPNEEVVTEAEKMRNLMKAVLLHGPLQEIEPAEATKEQWKVLKRRRRIMMETNKCPTCSGPLLEACPTSSREEFSEFMAVLLQGGKERKKIATEDEAMVADARSEHKLKRSKIEDIIKSDRVDRKTKIEIWRLLKKSMEILNQPPVKSQSEEAKMEDSESAVGNSKTKMVVTKRLDKNYIDILKNKPPPKPLILETHHMNQRTIDKFTAYDEVDRVLLEYLQCHSIIKGYAGPAGGHR